MVTPLAAEQSSIPGGVVLLFLSQQGFGVPLWASVIISSYPFFTFCIYQRFFRSSFGGKDLAVSPFF